MDLAVHFAADDALGGGDGQFAEGGAEVVDGGVAFAGDVGLGALGEFLGGLAGARHFVLAEAVGGLAGLFDQLLAFGAGLVQFRCHGGAGGCGLLAGLIGGGQAFADAVHPVVQGVEQGAVGQGAEQHQQDDVVDQVADQGGDVQAQFDHFAAPTPRRGG